MTQKPENLDWAPVAAEAFSLWGYALSDYQRMFDLSAAELAQPILDCAGGFSSFNADLTAQGGQVVSCDELYCLPQPNLVTRVEEALVAMGGLLQADPARFPAARDVTQVTAVIERRRQACQRFLQDYDAGLAAKRYTGDLLPKLSFTDQQFKLALCSHFLFATELLDLSFHIQAALELARVADEVRIFPLLNERGQQSDLLGPFMLTLQTEYGLGVEIRSVDYGFQVGGNAMLRLWRETCQVPGDLGA